MPQLFLRGSNSIARFILWGGLGAFAFAIWMAVMIYDSEYVTGVGIVVEQPIDFSHKHHVSEDGIDCRYCHPGVEYTGYGTLPSTSTCMTCHSELFNLSPMLAPVRTSYQTNVSIAWQKVVLVPDFVYFNHGAHINHGVGCSTCHGRVDTMSLVFNTQSFRMDWCVDCHTNPIPWIRPPQDVFNMEWTPPSNQLELGKGLAKMTYKIRQTGLTDCYTCHR